MVIADKVITNEVIANEIPPPYGECEPPFPAPVSTLGHALAPVRAAAELISDDLISDGLISDGLISDDLVSDDLISDDLISDDLISDDLISDDLISDDLISDYGMVGARLLTGRPRMVGSRATRPRASERALHTRETLNQFNPFPLRARASGPRTSSQSGRVIIPGGLVRARTRPPSDPLQPFTSSGP